MHRTPDKQILGREAAGRAAGLIQTALTQKGFANIILATGASQFEMLEHLINQPVDWSAVTCFHLDEYIGIPADHPASFRKYLKERFADKVRTLKTFHYVDGTAADPEQECRRLDALISSVEIDMAAIGIGENGHLAFNDPPADFTTGKPFRVVTLDKACRRQQMGEGWFPSLADVPRQAISMSIRQIMKARHIVCSVPDARKAAAVKAAVEHAVHPDFPATMLRRHPDCHLFLDTASASLLTPSTET